jgi:sulfite reductase (NADPH) flavoprotein alpha-component
MSQPGFIPVLPDSAPFTPEQRAYLNGFFAGLFSRTPGGAPAGGPAPASVPLVPLTILFGSQTGNAERLAKRIARDAGQRGFAPKLHEMGAYPVARLAEERALLLITSTYGDGEPPDNARAFWDFLAGSTAPALAQVRYSVCALGDTNYPKFCAFGRSLDERLEKLGANRVLARADCDVEFEASFASWLAGALPALAGGGSNRGDAGQDVTAGAAVTGSAAPTPVPLADTKPVASFDRKNPYPAPLVTNRRLNADGSAKDTRHFDFVIEGSGLTYQAGDALGVMPANCPELVDELLRAVRWTGEEAVPANTAGEVSLREALTRHYDITRVQPALLKFFAERTGDELLQRLTAPNVNGELTQFLRGREVIDLCLAYPAVTLEPQVLVGFLRKLQPRLYSISSSPKAHAGHVHLCVGIVRYESLGRQRKGVCSTFLAERVNPAASVPVFFHSNPNFRPPGSGDTPMIMVGPGTGIAPFRGFLHERRATGAAGRNWLFFGDQRGATDFLFREELEEFSCDGLLTRLDTAFSRDQAEKVYVQDRMREHAGELFAWLEAGAHFYVCGDASRMAKDVDAALHHIVQTAGGRTEEQAIDYVKALKSAKRYQRDVY